MPEGCHSALHQDPMGEECSPLRSPLSSSKHAPACVDARPDSCRRLRGGPPEGPGRRPVSLVSTLSSDSSLGGHSLSGSTAVLSPPSSSSSSSSFCSTVTPSVPSHEEDLDLQLSPSQGSTVSQGPPGGQWGEQHGLVVWGHQMSHFHDETTSGRRKGGGGGGAPHFQSSPVAADAMAPNPELSYVDRVVMEIIETERMYVQDLRSIVEDYLAKIIDARDLPILPEQVCALFGNIDDIYVFNSELLQSLDLCENDPVAIARCFVDQSEYFVIYTQYCTNYPNSVAALTECMRSKTLAKFFSDRQASLKRSLPLGSYLLKPVQRILKYHLLLEEIARHYDPEEMGCEVIQEAIDTMTGVAWYINDMKRRHEHAVRLQEIQSLLINWKGPDLTTCGELVLEGSFQVQRAKNSRTLFLFQKMLLITKKRGEHYVCKTHISCSTLMLLDSAKDPLGFSVIHFKHPRHLHTVQAKSMEEKRLWAHHIKRLIQENHNAIPQRDRETILEMDSLSAGRFRYSPERMKKAESFQSEDFPVGRTERRRSEPVRHTIRSTKGFLKHADSEGTLLGELCSLQPASSVSTLASSVGEPQAEGPGVEEELGQQKQQQEEDVEETSPKRPSLEQLSPSDAHPKRGSAPSEGGLEEGATQPQQLEEKEVMEVKEEEEEEDCYKEDILMGGDQVADFASSMMAAISCWHYRARALLSAPFSTDVQNTDAAEEKDPVGDVLESSTHDHVPCETTEEETLNGQVNSEDVFDSPCLTEPEVHTAPTEMNQFQTPDPLYSPVPLPDTQPQQQKTPDEATENVDEKEAESDCSGLLAEDSSFFSLGEYSEEDEETLTDCKSIPPSPVSDEATALVEHLGSRGSRRTSLGVSEDLCCQASQSSQPETPQPSVRPSACSDIQEEAPTASSDPRPELVSPSLPEETQEEEAQEEEAQEEAQEEKAQEEEVQEEEAAICASDRRSTLSKQDRLLIHKIRRYYEHQDTCSSIKRRESLSYIPAGLVRHLSKQLNGAPRGTPAPPPPHRKGSSASRPTSWSVFNLPNVDKNLGAESLPKPKPQGQGMPEASDGSTADEEFKPSSDMLHVWEHIEMGMNGQAHSDWEEPAGHGLEGNPFSGPIAADTSARGTGEWSLHTLEEWEPEHILKRCSVSAPPPAESERDAEESRASTAPGSGGNPCGARAPLPRIISLRSGTEDDQILQDIGKMKNKVFQLARQYSQRIKNNRPAIRQRLSRDPDLLHGLKSMPAVHEESGPPRDTGEHNLTCPLNTHDQVNANGDLSTLVASSDPGPSSGETTPSSPYPSPGVPGSPVEPAAFRWPDVHRLRSRYAGPLMAPGATGPPLVGRSSSAPGGTLGLCADGLGLPHHFLPWDSAESQSGAARQRRGSAATEDRGVQAALQRLCRWSSLDSVPAAAVAAARNMPLHELQNLQDPVRASNAPSSPPPQHKVKEVPATGNDSGGGMNQRLHSASKRPAVPRGGRRNESRIVKNLREKFQGLGSAS